MLTQNSEQSREKSKLLYKRFFDHILERNNPFFSIIIPVFNGSLHIHKALTSLLNQTFQNFEVLIMDGNSFDSTVEYTLYHTAGDKRFKVFSEQDLGIYDAMNKGVFKAKGKWIFFLGSDDEFYNNLTLQKTFEFVNSLIEPIGLVYGNVLVSGDVKWAKDGTKYDGEFNDSKIKKKNICHQAIFYNRSIKLNYSTFAPKSEQFLSGTA